jgi:hypothetical protein
MRGRLGARRESRENAAALAAARGYMPFSTAMAMLPAALVWMLVGGGRPQAGLFAEVFR